MLLGGLCAWLPLEASALPITIQHIAGVGDFKNPFVPDFYQHQKAGANANRPGERDVKFDDAAARPATVPDYATAPNWWEDGGGWCCVVSIVNSLYWLEQAYGIKGLYTRTDKEAAFLAANGRAPTWQEKMIFAVEDLAKDMGLTGLAGLADPAIPRSVRKLEAAAMFPAGAPYRKLSYDEFGVNMGSVVKFSADSSGAFKTEEPTSFGSLFDVYRAELCRSEDVTINIEYPEAVKKPVIDEILKRANALKMTFVPPRDLTEAEINMIIRDVMTLLAPDKPWWFFSFHVMTGAGVADCNDPTQRRMFLADPDKRNRLNAAGDAYLDEDVRERYPYDPTTPFPSGLIHYEAIDLDASGCITTALYRGACLSLVRAISPIPAPATLHSLVLGALALTWIRRRSPRVRPRLRPVKPAD